METSEKKLEKVEKNFEDVLALVGDFGAYQKFIITAALIPSSCIPPFIMLATLFQSVLPDKYWCDPPGRELTNLTQVEWWNLTVPRNRDGDFEKCSQYDFDVVQNSTDSWITIMKNKTKECTLKWAFDQSGMRDTLPTTMNLFCENEIYATHLFSVKSFGSIVGTAILAVIGDRYTGRRMVFFITIVIHALSKLFLLTVPFNPIRYFIRFCEGLPFTTDFNTSYVMGLELMTPEKRTIASCISFVSYTFGLCGAALVSWLIPYWWYSELFQLVTCLLLLLSWWIFPKSPRWLLSRGKMDESVDILMKIAKVNGKEVEREKLVNELSTINLTEETFDIKELIKHKRVFFHGVLLILYSTVVHSIYFTTVLNVKVLPENIFLSSFVVSIIEIPSNILSIISVHYLGRRFTAVFTMSFSLIFTVSAPFCLGERGLLLFVVTMIKFFIVQGLNVFYLVSCETLPTPIRSAGLGALTTFGVAGVFFSSYIIGAPGDEATQYWIMGGIQAVGVVVAFLLPETIGLPLPQTFPEANLVGKNRPFFKWIHHWNHLKFNIPE